MSRQVGGAGNVEHFGMIGLTFSTIPAYQAKQFPIPMNLDLYFRDRFLGQNITKSQYLGVALSVFF